MGPIPKKAVICAPDTQAAEIEKADVNFVYALAEAG
jgi:hypothetical protein